MKDNPAFPQGHPEMTIQGQTAAETQGMTMRQYYKAMAMQGILARTDNPTEGTETEPLSFALSGDSGEWTANWVAFVAALVADAMLREDQEHGD